MRTPIAECGRWLGIGVVVVAMLAPHRALGRGASPYRPGYRLHDGFFLRMAGGGAVQSLAVEPEWDAMAPASLTGVGIAEQFEVGWALVPGFVVSLEWGLMLGGASVFGRGDPSRGSLTSFWFGPALSFFPDPSQNFELGASVSPAFAGYEHDVVLPPAEPHSHDLHSGSLCGVGTAAWIAWGIWGGRSWDFGGMLRATEALYWGHASTSQYPGNGVSYDERALGWSLSLLFNIVYQ